MLHLLTLNVRNIVGNDNYSVRSLLHVWQESHSLTTCWSWWSLYYSPVMSALVSFTLKRLTWNVALLEPSHCSESSALYTAQPSPRHLNGLSWPRHLETCVNVLTCKTDDVIYSEGANVFIGQVGDIAFTEIICLFIFILPILCLTK